MGVLHGLADAGLGGEVHGMGEGDDIEELAEESGVVEVGVDDEDVGTVKEALAGALEGGVVVAVEVVEAEDVVAAMLEGEGDRESTKTAMSVTRTERLEGEELRLDLAMCFSQWEPL